MDIKGELGLGFCLRSPARLIVLLVARRRSTLAARDFLKRGVLRRWGKGFYLLIRAGNSLAVWVCQWTQAMTRP